MSCVEIRSNWTMARNLRLPCARELLVLGKRIPDEVPHDSILVRNVALVYPLRPFLSDMKARVNLFAHVAVENGKYQDKSRIVAFRIQFMGPDRDAHKVLIALHVV